MTSITGRVYGRQALFTRMKNIPNYARSEAARSMEIGANEIVAMMKSFVPDDEGELKNSIGWTWGKAPAGALIVGEIGGTRFGTLRIIIYAGNTNTIVTNKRGTEFQNARIQEFGAKARAGTEYKGRAPNPYFWVTWRILKRRTRSRITRNVRKSVKAQSGL